MPKYDVKIREIYSFDIEAKTASDAKEKANEQLAYNRKLGLKSSVETNFYHKRVREEVKIITSNQRKRAARSKKAAEK